MVYTPVLHPATPTQWTIAQLLRTVMSSFKRTAKAAVGASSAATASTNPSSQQPEYIQLTGTKPWVNTGLGIVSTGNKQLDELIGGGTALGTFTLIESDSFSTYGETLLLYGLAESISHKHTVLVIGEDTTEAERLVSALPYNQTLGSAGQDVIGASGGDSEEGTTTDNKLTIAWQYGKYIKAKDVGPMSSSSSGEPSPPSYCCSYDLSRRLQASILSNCSIALCPVSDIHKTASSPGTAEDYLQGIVTAVQSFLSRKHAPEKFVTRIVLSALDQILTTVAELTGTQCAVLRVAAFVLQLKHLVRACTTCRCSLHISVNPSNVSTQLVARLRQVADTVLSVESFAGRAHSVPYEFKVFQGFLVVQKIQQYGSMAPFRPPGTRFGLKRDRRKLHIEPLHLPPEESRAFSTTGGAQSSAVSEKDASTNASAGGVEHSHAHSQHSSAVAGLATGSIKDWVPAVSSGGASTGDTSTPSASGAPVPLTPLQASLAALKAARLGSVAPTEQVPSAGSAVPVVPVRIAPISIQRPAAAPQVKENKAPLQPGQACGGQSRGGSSQDSKYDF